MPISSAPARDRERHRALSSPTRTRLLELLRADRARGGTGLDARSLSDEVGLHVNTVRSHLAVLEDIGLATSQTEERRVRGRPRRLFRAAADTPAAEGDGYRFLAAVLSGALEDQPSHRELVVEVGERWGRSLLEQSAEPGTPDPGDAIARTTALFDDLGFAARRQPSAPGRIELHHCPFRSLAATNPDVVCGVHLGILRGALAAAGAAAHDVTLSPFVTESLCVATVDA